MIDEPAIRGNSVEPVLSCLLRLPRSFKPRRSHPPSPPSPPRLHHHLSTSLFRFPAPSSAPTLSPSVLNKSARYLIVTGPPWKVPSKFPFYYLCQRERLNYLEILLNENLFLWFSEALEYAADALLEFFSWHAHPPHMSLLKSWRHSSCARKKNIRVVRDIRNYSVGKL